MYGREELNSYWGGDKFDVYDKYEADSVMDAMEARIKELESIPHTDNTAVIEALQRDKDDLIELNEKRIARIQELEETKSKMYDANQLMNASIKELERSVATLTRKYEYELAKATEWGNVMFQNFAHLVERKSLAKAKELE